MWNASGFVLHIMMFSNIVLFLFFEETVNIVTKKHICRKYIEVSVIRSICAQYLDTRQNPYVC